MALRSNMDGYLYSAMRFVIGFLFLFHGLQKVLGMYGGTQMALATLPGIAGIIELVGGTLVAIGLFTSPVAFVCSGEMAVAYFMAHQPKGTWPIENQGELAALYCFVFLYIAARGGGPISLDRLLRGQRG
jgi:putative oxidoreductase